MLSKSLIQFSVDGWSCAPSLLFTWGQTIVDIMKIMVKVKVKSFSGVRLSETPWTVALPGSSVRGISQARVLEWGAIPFSRGSSQPRDQTRISCTAGRFSTAEPQTEAPIISSELPQIGHPSVLTMTKPRVLHPLPAAGATETDAERGRHREPPQASQAEESESIFIICQVEIKYSWGFLLGTQRTPDLQKTRGDLLGPQQMDMTRSSALDKSLQWLP